MSSTRRDLSTVRATTGEMVSSKSPTQLLSFRNGDFDSAEDVASDFPFDADFTPVISLTPETKKKQENV